MIAAEDPCAEDQHPCSGHLTEKREALLTNPEFMLLSVPREGEREMRLVQPANNPKLRKELKERSDGTLYYFTLSHVWGIHSPQEKEENMWDVGSFILDEHGEPMKPVPMRKEKRDTLYTLLRKQPGYWWIDVICTRDETLLGIMGSIYGYCCKCYAMVDCEPHMLQGLTEDRVSQMFREYIQIRCKGDKHEHPTEGNTYAERWSNELQLMRQLTRCNWFKRVWTWQEATLPFWTELIPESGGGVCTNNGCPMPVQHMPVQRFCYFSMRMLADDLKKDRHLHGIWREDTLQALRMISDSWREIHEAYFYRRFKDNEHTMCPVDFLKAMEGLGISKRTCSYPVDYVYGVLGMLHLNIERMDDPQAVWSRFLEELDRLIPSILEYNKEQRVKSITISNKARNVNLSEAKTMADVYYELFDVTY